MSREEKVKRLYIGMCGEDDLEYIEDLCLEDLEEGLLQYVQAAGFEYESVDELLNDEDIDVEFFKL